VTFGPALYSAPLDGGLLGIESAFGDPLTIYLSMYTTPGVHPILVSTGDGGATWSPVDLEPALGNNGFRIIAVDPQDAKKLYLRVTEDIGEALAVTTDGGSTFTVPARADDRLTAFARLASGTVLVAGSSTTGPVGFRSTDGGATFQAWPGVPHLRALGERGGKLFAAGDNYKDGFAVGVSTDEGMTFQPLLTYDKVMGIKPCVQSICRDICDYQAGLTLWPPEVCQEGGVPPPAPAKGGCGCRAAGDGAASLGTLMLALGAIGLGISRRRLYLSNSVTGPCRRQFASGWRSARTCPASRPSPSRCCGSARATIWIWRRSRR
jgi:MYXO-CTERM domain-containing protein